MTTDGELLRRYAEASSQEAFAELVRRHLDLVFSAAMRQVNGDAHLAQDVAQSVFTDLARKAAALSRRETLTGWLYTSTHFAAAKAVRAEQRRHFREQEAHAMQELIRATTPGDDWGELRPVLDRAMHQLSESDRELILLRYFENRRLGEIGGKLGLSEDSARKRVDRAVEKLRRQLVRRGVSAAAAGLAAAISANAIEAAPAGLAATLTSSSLAGATAGTASTLTLAKLMALTKFKLAAVSAIVVAGATTSLMIQNHARAEIRGVDAALREQMDAAARLQTENERLAHLTADKASLNTLDELQRLRADVARLREQTNNLAALRDAHQRLTARNPASPTESKTLLQTREEEKETAYATMNYMKRWTLAFLLFAEENRHDFPTNFQQALPFLPDDAKKQTNMTIEQFELAYQGSFTNIPDPSATMVMRSRQPWLTSSGNWVRGYGFADGHCEIHSEASPGAFDIWESKHTFPASARSQ